MGNIKAKAKICCVAQLNFLRYKILLIAYIFYSDQASEKRSMSHIILYYRIIEEIFQFYLVKHIFYLCSTYKFTKFTLYRREGALWISSLSVFVLITPTLIAKFSKFSCIPLPWILTPIGRSFVLSYLYCGSNIVGFKGFEIIIGVVCSICACLHNLSSCSLNVLHRLFYQVPACKTKSI